MRISDRSSDVCSSDLKLAKSDEKVAKLIHQANQGVWAQFARAVSTTLFGTSITSTDSSSRVERNVGENVASTEPTSPREMTGNRSDDHTSALPSLMRNSYAGFRLKNKTFTTFIYHITPK